MMGGWYLAAIRNLVILTAGPTGLVIGTTSTGVRDSIDNLKLGPGRFSSVDEALALVATSSIVTGGVCAVVGILSQLAATVTGLVGLHIVARLLLSGIAPAGVLLVSVRTRSVLAGRKFENESGLVRPDLTPAIPRPWEIIALAAAAIASWLLLA